MIRPCKTGEIAAYDTWALQLLSKVLAEYYAYCDYEYLLQSEWRYALRDVSRRPEAATVTDAYPFSSLHPPLTLRARVQRIDWEMEDGFETVCAAYPQSCTPIAPPETIDLIPYGCAKLRITELPQLP